VKPASQPRVLFLTRRYPPCIGGIETHCYELFTRLQRRLPVRLVALRYQHLAHLAWFLPGCLLLTFWLLLWRRIDVVYFSDGVVASLAPLLRALFRRARFVTTVYGLELTYRNPLARWLMAAGASRCDRVVVISQNTLRLAEEQGIGPERLRIAYLGVEPLALTQHDEETLRARFEAEHGLRFCDQRILLNFGRQVQRKGVVPFLEQAMPLLEGDIHLIIGGSGPELPRIRELAAQAALAARVHVLGRVDEDILTMLRSNADLFLMPNIPMADDVEGFGQTQLECMHAGTPAVAFAVDALTESVREGGYLIAPHDYRAFVDQIHAFYALHPAQRRAKQDQARTYVRREYSWDATTDQYLEIFTGND
jgi:phosphatidyl-myo-inositol dimannoside synthase